MNVELYNKLRQKDWKRSEINKALKIFGKAESSKAERIKKLDAAIYWFVLIITIFGNLVISIALVPFLLEFSNLFLYMIITLFALMFGALFDLLLRDIESLEQKHIFIAGLFIPSLAAVNIFYITSFSNYVAVKLGLENIHNPFFVSVIYVIAFVLPYLVYKIVNKEPFY